MATTAPTVEEALKVLESNLDSITGNTQLVAALKKAMEDNEEKDKSARGKGAADDDNEKNKDAKGKGAADDDDDKNKDAADDDDSEENGEKPFTGKRGKRGKKASDDDDDEKEAKIAQLQAALDKTNNQLTIMKTKPLVDRMLTARLDAGMDPEAVKKMQTGLYAATEKQILQRYEEDKVFLEGGIGLVASAADTSQMPGLPQEPIPFNGGLDASQNMPSGKTLEEMLP